MPRYPQEKKPKLIANLGDASPFEHGGYFIYDNGDGTYTGHYWDGPDEDEPTEVFRFDIPEDVFADLSWVDLKPVASFVGSTKEKLDRAGRSGDVRTRAWAVRDAGSYHGFHNLDDYPRNTTRPCWRGGTGATTRHFAGARPGSAPIRSPTDSSSSTSNPTRTDDFACAAMSQVLRVARRSSSCYHDELS